MSPCLLISFSRIFTSPFLCKCAFDMESTRFYTRGSYHTKRTERAYEREISFYEWLPHFLLNSLECLSPYTFGAVELVVAKMACATNGGLKKLQITSCSNARSKFDRLRTKVLEVAQRENIILVLPELCKNRYTRKLLIDFVLRTGRNI